MIRLNFSKIFSLAAVVAALAATAACGGDSTTGPTPPPPAALAVSCPSPFGVLSPTTVGVAVNYATPVATGGQAPVGVTCNPLSGQLFTPGTTTVTCTARDAVQVTASCTFAVTVTVPPRLSRTSFMAFGDSITSGEVTVPVTTSLATGEPVFKQVLVPSAAYPTVLENLLDARYLAQTPSVVNAGRPGEATADAVPRFRTAMAANRPEVVLLLDGHNDLGNTTGALAGYNALVTMVREAKAAGVRVFVATLVPSISGRQRSQNQSLLLQYNDAVRTMAAAEGVVLVDLYNLMLPDVNTLIGVDGLHPNEAGYARMAQLFFSAIRANLEVP
ncbi:MAG: SGNH/GDSL hydrolase family protein [Vicinamibacterales bacterium]